MGMATAAFVYAAVTALLFRNLLPGLTTHLYSDLGDPLLNAAILAWNAKQVPLSEGWWNFPAFAPVAGVTTFTEHLLLTYPVASPIIWATGNPILAANVVFLAAPVLNAVATFALVRELTQSTAGAFVAGLAFAFAPYQSSQLSHIQTMTAFGMPMALLGLLVYVLVRSFYPARLAGRGASQRFTLIRRSRKSPCISANCSAPGRANDPPITHCHT